jgi:iron-only hydrogenase group A
MPKATINNIPVNVADGVTILKAAQSINIKIPTLCYLQGTLPTGSCRVCLVEVEGYKDPVASCTMPISEGMKITTNSIMARNARRSVVELLLSEHQGECQTCDRGSDCELQRIANELGVKQIHFTGEKTKKMVDCTTPGLVRDSSKCILCRRCVTVCAQIQGVGSISPQGRGFKSYIGPAFCAGLDSVTCVQCGQCSAICPVGAISEKDNTDDVWRVLESKKQFVIVETAPAIRAALGEYFGYPPGTLVTGKMITALKKLGFDAVFDTNFAADLTIIEESTELLERLKQALVKKDKNVALPMFTSCSPGWINYAEAFFPEIIPNISTCKSPQQMFGAIAKSYYAQKIGKNPEDIVVISVMPCTAKKYEAQRPEMHYHGIRDVDIVLTTRELGKMIKQAGLDFDSLENSVMDSPIGLSSGAADIFGNTGGVMEAALRTAYELVTGTPFPFDKLHVTPIAGLEGIKEASIKITQTVPQWSFLKGVELKVAVAHGLANAKKLIEAIKNKEVSYHFIEVMCCPGGCIGGGGQPRFTTDEVRQARIQALYREDEGKKLRKSHENPDIIKIYKEFFKKPLGEKSHQLLHTHYHPKERI